MGLVGVGLAQFVNSPVKSVIVIRCPGDLAEQVKALRV